MDMSQYMGMFLDEAGEHLQTLNQRLLELENAPENHEIVDEIFRAAHTLKGMAATMGFNKIAELTHEMENVLHKVRSNEEKITPVVIDVLFACLDKLSELVNAVSEGNDESMIAIDALVARLKNAFTAEAKTEADAKQVAEQGESLSFAPETDLSTYDQDVIQKALAENFNCYYINVKLAPGCLLKSVRAFMVFRKLEQLGDIIKSIPEAQEIEDEKFDLEFSVVLITREAAEKVRTALLSIAEITAVEVTPLANLFTDSFGGKEVAAGIDVAVRLEQQQEEQQQPQHGSQQTHEHHKKIRTNQTVRVDIERLDKLMNLVAEIVINKTRLDQIKVKQTYADLGETVEHIGRVTSELQDIVMKIRMVPIEQVFNRFPRMVRDLAKEMGKEIDLVIEGQETELDRSIIDEIGDPLVHLLRNAVDHGIEGIAERERSGKPRHGTVRLSAQHKGDSVLIEVEDDGKGIDPEVLKAKAVEKGLITPNEAKEMDNDTALKLIFRAGFSTAEKVTDVSGRGVGLDAVENKIRALGGFIDLDTTPGAGTKITIRLPLTLAIIQALLISVYHEIYAIPLSFIDETVTILPQEIRTVQNQEVVLLRGEVLPLVRLEKFLEAVRPADAPQEEELYVVIVRKGNQRAGLVVNELIGQQEIVIKSLGDLIGSIKGIAGATILGDGCVALILDVGGII